MRSLLVLSFLLAVVASASAAPRSVSNRERSPAVSVRGMQPAYVGPGGSRIYRDDSAPGGFRTDYDPPPAPNDPSRRGGG